MTLRTRLICGLVAVVIVVIGAGVIAAVTHRDYVYGQIDEQLERFAERTGALPPFAVDDATRTQLPAQIAADGPPQGIGVLNDLFFGVVLADGTVRPLFTPTEDPDIVPEAPPPTSDAVTVDTVRGLAEQMRAVRVQLSNGADVVFAVGTSEADAANARLLGTLAIAGLVVIVMLAFVGWWVIRLGVAPLRRVTEAADAITAGDTEVRVDEFPGQTEAARLSRAFNVMVDSSAADEERLRRFVADASHELRTPLTTVRGYASLHRGRVARRRAEEVDDALRRIDDEAARMGRLVDDLLVLADLDEPGLAAVDRVDVDLARVVHDLAGDMQVVQPARPVSVQVDVADAAVVPGDRDAIVQSIAALTGNAMRHTDPEVPVELVVRRTPSSVRVEVRDAGPGVPADHLDHVYERFYRADPSRARVSGGNGLGLAIVAAIVDAHAGRCGVLSPVAEGRGTCFWLEFPTA